MRTPRLLAAGTTSINMTPMIDVVFLLIIFFLVSSHLAQQENAVELDLPLAVSGLQDTVERDTFVVNVLQSGGWQVAGENVDAGRIAAQLRQRAMAAEQPLQLKIRTDQHVPYSRIQPLLSLAADAGIGDIVFSVYPEHGS